MTEWSVVTVIVVLVGLFCAIAGPMLKLNTSITKLTVTLEATGRDLADVRRDLALLEEASGRNLSALAAKDSDGRRRLWEKNEEQDRTLVQHAQRLNHLEHRKEDAKHV